MRKNRFSQCLAVKWRRQTRPEWMVEDMNVSSGACVCAFRLGGTVCVSSNLLHFMMKGTEVGGASVRNQVERVRKYGTKTVRGLR